VNHQKYRQDKPAVQSSFFIFFYFHVFYLKQAQIVSAIIC
jgi:hypothetical protein